MKAIDVPAHAADRTSRARSRWGHLLDKQRPEWAAGGYAHDNTGIEFYSRVNALLKPEMVLVDLGAGRGVAFRQDSGASDYLRQLAKFQGKVAKVIGLDVDEAIAQHPFLDERHLITPDGAFPLADQTADVIVADWVFEHIEDPSNTAAEIERVLKPGGWLCARTPNKWGYIGMGARLVPNRLHEGLLTRLSPTRPAVDIFPVAYKLNTIHDLKRYFPKHRWSHHSFLSTGTPSYSGGSALLFSAIDFYQHIVPKDLKTHLLVFLHKRSGPDQDGEAADHHNGAAETSDSRNTAASSVQ